MSKEGDIAAINEGRIDSRLQSKTVTHPTLPLERTFCAFCGRPKGWVTHESSEFIDAANVVVVCDDCNAKFEAKLGKLPGEAPVVEYDLRDAEIGVDQAFLDSINTSSSEWVENCVDCRIPMIKLQQIAPSKVVPLMDSLRVGGSVLDKNRTAAIARATPSAIPQWFCRKCRSLWGPIDMFWCKFKRV